MNVTVSIIVPVYNSSKFLLECLESVKSQTFNSWECIIINDGSTDDSAELIKTFLSCDNRFNYFEISNSGPSHARNFGVNQSSGKYILPLDADDHISPNYLEECVTRFDSNKKLTVVYGAVQNFGQINDFQFDESLFEYKEQLVSNKIHVSGLFLRETFLQIGGYDIKMLDGFEDWEFYIRLITPESKVAQIKNAVLYYRRKINSRNEDLIRNDKKKFYAELYIYNKHIDKYEQHFNGPISTLYLNTTYNSLEKKLSYFQLMTVLIQKVKYSTLRYLNNISYLIKL